MREAPPRRLSIRSRSDRSCCNRAAPVSEDRTAVRSLLWEIAMFVQVINAHAIDQGRLREQFTRWATDLRPRADGFLGSTAGTAAVETHKELLAKELRVTDAVLSRASGLLRLRMG